jgi:multicomponent K+:H+ antiporter subunit D
MPPLSGFIGKLLVMDALRDNLALIWTVILVSSFLMVVGFARAGSVLFWKSHATGDAEVADHEAEPLAFVAVGGFLAGLVLLTVFAGPVMAWLELTAATLHAPDAYIAANQLPEVN